MTHGLGWVCGLTEAIGAALASKLGLQRVHDVSHFVVRHEPSEAASIFNEAEASCPGQLRTGIRRKGSGMRARGVFMSFGIAIGCGLAVQNAAFSQGTDQQMACTPDVWRLCGAQIPDAERIVACLRRNTSQLSGPCRAVFEQTARREDQPTSYQRDYRPRSYDRDYRRPYDRGYGLRPYDDD
jgi:hypothetical protein